LTRLRYPHDFVKRVSWLVARHMRFAPMLIRKNNTLLRWIRSEATTGAFRTEAEMAEAFAQLVEIFLADMGATWAGVLQEPVMEEGRRLGEEAIEIAREQMPVHTSDLKVRGGEIQQLLAEIFSNKDKSIAVGKNDAGLFPVTVGDAMKYLLKRVQNGSLPNDKDALLSAMQSKIARIKQE